MKIQIKLIFGFLIAVLLVGTIGIFFIISSKNIKTNEKIGSEITSILSELEINTVNLLITTDLEEYETLKKVVLNLKDQLNSFSETNRRIIASSELFGSVEANIKDFIIISDQIADIHKEMLTLNKAFEENYGLEKNNRYNITIPLFALNDSKVTEDAGNMKYYSKEFLYQYRDKKHLDEWQISIEKVKNTTIILDLPPLEKNRLLDTIDVYESVVKSFGKLVLKQKQIEDEESLKIEELKKIIVNLEDSRKSILTEMKLNTDRLNKKTINLLIIIILAELLISFVIYIIIANSISQPINRLTTIIEDISTGKLDVHIEPKLKELKDEIGRLANAFDRTLVSLKLAMRMTAPELKKESEELKKLLDEKKKTEQELQQQKKEFQDILENSRDLIQSVNENQEFIYVNKKWMDTLRYSEDEVKKLHITDIIHKDQLAHCMKIFEDLSKGMYLNKVETVFVSKDGREIFVEGDVNAQIKDGASFVTRGIFRDITERKKAEEEINKRNKEFERFNKLAIDRELKMIELKKRIKELEENKKQENSA